MMYLRLIFYLFIILPTWCLLTENESNCEHRVESRCFHQSEEACPGPENQCKCHQLPKCKSAVVCCNVTQFTLTEGLACAKGLKDGIVEAVHIRNANLSVLNMSMTAWRRLKYLTITDGQINYVTGEFVKHSLVSCLNLSSNGIAKFEQRSLVNLFNLSYLDLSHNNLSSVPRFKKEGLVTLDISDNPSMQCISVLDTLKRSDIDINNDKGTFCLSSVKTFDWFNSTEQIPLSQVQYMLEIETNCIKNCTCKPYRMEIVLGKQPTISVAVNCSGVGLLSLPLQLPPYTVSLNITNNNITTLKELSDQSYQHLMYLYADNNQISTIQHMEGTKFMNNFMALSLKNNRIKTFETYLLSNIKFYRTSVMRYINLGKNMLHCDCKTAKEFKVWLLSKLEHVPDYEEIGCDNMDVKIIELDHTKLCQSQQDWTDYIYYIITAEVLLLVGLIAKVSYDYWVFKTAGYLPWPASKMPKLPCDWLCE